MAVDMVSEIWSQLKRYISSVDRQEAAEELVSLLIDHDYSAEDIRDEFKGDSHIKSALTPYFEHIDEPDDDEDDGYYTDDDDEDEEDY